MQNNLKKNFPDLNNYQIDLRRKMNNHSFHQILVYSCGEKTIKWDLTHTHTHKHTQKLPTQWAGAGRGRSDRMCRPAARLEPEPAENLFLLASEMKKNKKKEKKKKRIHHHLWNFVPVSSVPYVCLSIYLFPSRGASFFFRSLKVQANDPESAEFKSKRMIIT